MALHSVLSAGGRRYGVAEGNFVEENSNIFSGIKCVGCHQQWFVVSRFQQNSPLFNWVAANTSCPVWLPAIYCVCDCQVITGAASMTLTPVSVHLQPSQAASSSCTCTLCLAWRQITRSELCALFLCVGNIVIIINAKLLLAESTIKGMSSHAVDLVLCANPSSSSWVWVGECFFWYRLTWIVTLSRNNAVGYYTKM